MSESERDPFMAAEKCEDLERGISILESELKCKSEILFQDGKWNIYDEDGEGLTEGYPTLEKLILKIGYNL